MKANIPPEKFGSIEFFTNDPKIIRDEVMLVNSRRQYLGYNKISADDRFRLLNLLKASDDAIRCLAAMGEYGIQSIEDKLLQFIKCNFAELDQVDDITPENALNFEYVNCGLKANNRCPYGKKFCIIKKLSDILKS